MIVGRTAETIMYNYDGPVHLVSEVDGVRVLSGSSHEMIQKVPSVVQKIFRINSIDPAAYLLEASKQFQKKSHKADSYIDLVKDKLDSAIRTCIDGASHEFDFATQKILVRVRVTLMIVLHAHDFHSNENQGCAILPSFSGCQVRQRLQQDDGCGVLRPNVQDFESLERSEASRSGHSVNVHAVSFLKYLYFACLKSLSANHPVKVLTLVEPNEPPCKAGSWISLTCRFYTSCLQISVYDKSLSLADLTFLRVKCCWTGWWRGDIIT